MRKLRLMLLLSAARGVAALALTAGAAPASDLSAPLAQPSAIPHRVGQILNYSLHGDMLQTIKGHDVSGRAIDQQLRPTQLNGHERIAIRSVSDNSITLHRSGSVTAMVGGHMAKQDGSGLTVVSADGAVVKDKSTLAGLFLLPVSFFGARSVYGGAELQTGSSWTDQLQTKLFGMLEPPLLHFAVTGQRKVLGVDVFSIEASGVAEMKEPVFTNAGHLLGYASGNARIGVKFDYDQDRRRVVSMVVEVHGVLHFPGPAAGGSVQERQRYLVALDTPSLL